MRRTFGFLTIGTLLTFFIACSSDDDVTGITATGAGGAAGGSGAGGSGTAGTAGNGTAGTGGGSGGGSSGNGGGSPDGSADADGGIDGPVNALFSFFITSTGSGATGGNLGGLSGADQKCQMLATAVGAGSKTWHAYLSLSSGGTDGGTVNARDRIGSGPWYNVKGVLIATTLGALHEEADAGMNGLTAVTGLDEHGNPVPVGGDAGPSQHDILTGSQSDGRAFPALPDYTCAGWTSSEAGPPPIVVSDAAADAVSDVTSDASDAAPQDAGMEAAVDAEAGDAALPGPRAYVGHFNRTGTNAPPLNSSWNSSHATPGCAQADLMRVGGAGRLYCFAIN